MDQAKKINFIISELLLGANLYHHRLSFMLLRPHAGQNNFFYIHVIFPGFFNNVLLT